MGRALQDRRATQPLTALPSAELHLSAEDPKLAQVIARQAVRWPSTPTEDTIWGLIRIVTAQQISTAVACRLAEKMKAAYPMITTPSSSTMLNRQSLRGLGLPERRAQCCIDIIQRSDEIRTRTDRGETWEVVLAGIKGIGPWTISVFRIMVLRDPDELPLRDVGLLRAVENVYGSGHKVEDLSERWRPFRSVACWYLWRTLGNQQLG